MSESDLHSRLLNSTSYLSLASERKVLSTLKGLNWGAIHSCFYTDLKTEKLREIDVLGRRVWTRKLKSGSQSADLNLIVEVKSAKGFHLLFSTLEGSTSYRQSNEFWIGQQGEYEAQIAEVISQAGINSEHCAYILKWFERQAYPRQEVNTSRLFIEPPPAKYYVSSFRETNIGGEKELDSSVLWKASLALDSAVSNIKKQILDFILESLKEYIELAPYVHLNPVKEAKSTLDRYVRVVQLFHPVVVIDAPLWEVKEGSLNEIEWCRFQLVQTRGDSNWWFDVVNSAHFEEYARQTTNYYEAQFRKVRAKPDKSVKFTTYPHRTE